MSVSLRLAALAVSSRSYSGAGKRGTAPEPASPDPEPVTNAHPRPDPGRTCATQAGGVQTRSARDAGQEAAEAPRITFKKLANVPSVTEKTPFTLNLKNDARGDRGQGEGRGAQILSNPDRAVGILRTLPDGNLLVKYHNTIATLDLTSGELKNEVALKDVFDIHAIEVTRDGRRAVVVLRNTGAGEATSPGSTWPHGKNCGESQREPPLAAT